MDHSWHLWFSVSRLWQINIVVHRGVLWGSSLLQLASSDLLEAADTRTVRSKPQPPMGKLLRTENGKLFTLLLWVTHTHESTRTLNLHQKIREHGPFLDAT